MCNLVLGVEIRVRGKVCIGGFDVGSGLGLGIRILVRCGEYLCGRLRFELECWSLGEVREGYLWDEVYSVIV